MKQGARYLKTLNSEEKQGHFLAIKRVFPKVKKDVSLQISKHSIFEDVLLLGKPAKGPPNIFAIQDFAQTINIILLTRKIVQEPHFLFRSLG